MLYSECDTKLCSEYFSGVVAEQLIVIRQTDVKQCHNKSNSSYSNILLLQ